MIKPEFLKKSIRSYVIRAGRITESQKSAFERWWPQYGLSLYHGLLDIESCYERNAPTIVEVGFGMGDSLLTMTKSDQNKNFIGIEVHPPGVGRLIACAGKEDVRNLKVYMADALDVLAECIPENSIDRLQLFFPDPWHKKKHHKRRIIQSDFVDVVLKKLKQGGHFHIATDWEDYADHIMEVMHAAPGYQNTAGEYLYASRPSYRPTTKFETRGQKLGHKVWDIIFSKK